MSNRRWIIIWAIFLSVCFAVAWSDAIPMLGILVSFSVGFLFGHLFSSRRVFVREVKRQPFYIDEPYDAAFDAKSLKEREDVAMGEQRCAT